MSAQKLTEEQKIKVKLAKARKIKRKLLRSAFSADDINSRPNPKQEEVLKCDKQIQFIIAGNRCLVEGTLVLTPKGPVPIEKLQPGDTVYDEHGKPIKVKKTFYNGEKEVADLSHRGRQLWGACTKEHKWLTRKRDRNDTITNVKEKHTAGDLHRKGNVVRTFVKVPLGEVKVETAYVIGAMLGDGCCTCPGTKISSPDENVPNKIAKLLKAEACKVRSNNYTWDIKNAELLIPFSDWFDGKYSHQRHVDLEEVKTWDRDSVIKLLAGIFDTDGSLVNSRDGYLFRVSMQAESVMDFVQWALLALWQVEASRNVDSRTKYKNGDVHNVTIRNPHEVERVMEELGKELVTPRRHLQKLENTGNRSFTDCVKLSWGKNKRVEKTYDIHVDSPTNLYLLANGLVTSNSGKTQTGARIVAHFFNGDHPYLEHKKEWPSELQIIIMGQSRANMDNEIWNKKLRPFLGSEGTDYKVDRSGGNVLSVKNLHLGHTILFMTHGDAEQARIRGQGFTAQIVWVDEMPSRSSIVTEMILRVMTSNGLIYFTFTPLISNQEIRKIVEEKNRKKVKHTLSVLDNPVMSPEDRADYVEYLRSISSSEADFNARLQGDWIDEGLQVFSFDSERNSIRLEKYEPAEWLHMVVVDQAHTGKAGLGVFAKMPTKHSDDEDVWVMVKGKYIEGKGPSLLVEEVEKEVANFNVFYRICDSNPPGFYMEAEKMGIKYIPIFGKNNNKEKWIEETNDHFVKQKLYIADNGSCQLAMDELSGCTRKEDDPTKIVKASKFHLADTIRYFIVMKPKVKVPDQPTSAQNAIKRAWKQKQKEKREEAAKKELEVKHKKERRQFRVQRRSERRRSRRFR